MDFKNNNNIYKNLKSPNKTFISDECLLAKIMHIAFDAW